MRDCLSVVVAIVIGLMFFGGMPFSEAVEIVIGLAILLFLLRAASALKFGIVDIFLLVGCLLIGKPSENEAKSLNAESSTNSNAAKEIISEVKSGRIDTVDYQDAKASREEHHLNEPKSEHSAPILGNDGPEVGEKAEKVGIGEIPTKDVDNELT